MLRTIKGPAIFLAQFAGDKPPFNSLDSICGWAASLGYKGVQVPTWEDPRFIDLAMAANSRAYCDDWRAPPGQTRLHLLRVRPYIQNRRFR